MKFYEHFNPVQGNDYNNNKEYFERMNQTFGG